MAKSDTISDSSLAQPVMTQNGNSFANGELHGKNQIIKNLKLLLNEYPSGITLTTLEDTYQKKVDKSLLSVLLKLVLSDDFDKLASITLQDGIHKLCKVDTPVKHQENTEQTPRVVSDHTNGSASHTIRDTKPVEDVERAQFALLSDDEDEEQDYKSSKQDSMASIEANNKMSNIKTALNDEQDTGQVPFTSQDQATESLDTSMATNGHDSNEQIFDESRLHDISATGVVSRGFSYTPNPLIDNDNQPFSGVVSHIDKRHQYIYVQPEYCMSEMENVTEELEIYYSHPISENLLVKDIEVGLACVCKYDSVYHRIQIKENRPYNYVITYVDLGITEEIEKAQSQFKHLLNYFALFPCMAIPCRLADVEFKLDNYQMKPAVYEQLYALCEGDSFHIEPYSRVGDILYVKMFNTDQLCLNHAVIDKGLGFKTKTLSTMTTKNGVDNQKASHVSSSIDLNKQPSNNIHGTQTASKTVKSHEQEAMDAYDTETYAASQPISEQTPYQRQYSDNKRAQRKTPHSRSMTKLNTQSTRKESENVRNTESTNRQRRQDNSSQEKLKVTINQANLNTRLVSVTLRSALSFNQRRDQRQVSRTEETIPQLKKNEFINWMCSWSIEQSLWSSDAYRNALLKYIGRIYKQAAHMYRYFAQLKNDMPKLDELDLLNKLIENTKQRQHAQKSFDEWKDDSRINRRLNDLRIIFEFNGNYRPSNNPFKITTNGLQQIIDRQKIKSYFDLGCGDGTITAGIGAYLGLNKQQIFGGDIFEGQCQELTFIKIDEKQSTIALPNTCVDLITAFVTFHHVSQVDKTLKELVRITRPGGYLIIREHDCKNEHSLSAKYLNFVHAIMMIAGVGEFADAPINSNNKNQPMLNDYENETKSWSEQKSYIIDYTKTIHYRTCDEWTQELGKVGFRHRATLHYGANGSDNPQKLFYAVYQMNEK